MRSQEFLEQLESSGKIVDTLTEIITIDRLAQPSEEHKKKISDRATIPIEEFSDMYWGMYNDIAVIAAKNHNNLLGYAVCVKLENKKSKDFPYYICPKNLYSWAKDSGVTALNLIKAIIRLAGNIPVMSDIELSPSAKKFLKKNVESGALKGKVFNLSTGQVTPYDADIWLNDDNYRILFIEHGGIAYATNSLIIEGTWNWKNIDHSACKLLFC